jgi:hypothetical protein
MQLADHPMARAFRMLTRRPTRCFAFRKGAALHARSVVVDRCSSGFSASLQRIASEILATIAAAAA